MLSFIKAKTFIVILLVLLPYVVSLSQEDIRQDEPHPSKILTNHHQIVVHGFLLWASMGFLIPVGILIIRLSNREECGRRLRIMLCIHAATQILSAILITAGAVLSIKNFSNAFDNMHQRVGVALYGLVMLQAVSGLLRPARGSKRRSIWFFAHWVLGTTVSLLGIINIYSGLQAYQRKTSRSMKLWVVFYTAEMACIGLFYMFQDKWEYIQKQGVILGDEPTTTMTTATTTMTTIQPTDDVLPKHKQDAS